MSFTHYVRHSDIHLAWTSCKCHSTKNHLAGAEVFNKPTPLPVESSCSDYLRGVRAGRIAERQSRVNEQLMMAELDAYHK